MKYRIKVFKTYIPSDYAIFDIEASDEAMADKAGKMLLEQWVESNAFYDWQMSVEIVQPKLKPV